MLGKVGSLQNIPAPTATVLNEALKLLSTFGDSKSISKLLEQVKEVQEHNEHVFREAQASIAELKSAQAVLEAEKQKHSERVAQESTALNKRTIELSQAEAQLSGRKLKCDQEMSFAKESLNEEKEAVAMAERAVSQREMVCDQRENDLSILEARLNTLQKSLDVRAQQLKDRESKLRIALGVE